MPIGIDLEFPELPGEQFSLEFADDTPDDIINQRVDAFRTNIRQGIDFSQRINTQATGFQYPVRTPPSFRGPTGIANRERYGMNQPASQERPDKIIEWNNAEQAGIDTRTGAPARFRAIKGLLNVDPEVAEASIDFMARQQIREAGIEVPDSVSVTFIDEFTGEPAYLRPETGPDGQVTLRPTLVNPAGIDRGDAIEFGPEVGSALFEGSVGGAVGAFTGGAGVVGGAAAGAYIATELRREIAKMAGIPESIANGIDREDQFTAAMWSLGGDAAIAGVLASRHIPKLIRGASIPADRYEALRNKMQESLARVDALKAVVGDDPDVAFAFSIGQLTGDPVLLELEARMKTQAVGRLGERISQQEIQARKSMVESLRRIMTKAAPGASDNIRRAAFTQTDDEVLEEARKFVGAQQEAIENMSEVEVDRLMANAPNMLFNRQFWGAVQTRMDEMLTAADDVEQLSWKLFNQTIGWDEASQTAQIFVNNPRDSFINKALQKISLRSGQSLSQQVRDSHQKILGNLGWGEGQFMDQKYLDFNALHEARSQLNALLQRVNAREEVGWSAHDINSVIKAIDDQIATTEYSVRQDIRKLKDKKGYAQYQPLSGKPLSQEEIELAKLKPNSRVLELLDTARNPEEAVDLTRDLQLVSTKRTQTGEETILEGGTSRVEPIYNEEITIESAENLRYRIFSQWQAAMQATQMKNMTYDNYTVNKILERTADGKSFKSGPQAVRELAFKDNVALRNVLEAVNQNPQIKRGLIEEFERYARNEILIEGKWSPTRFAKFYNSHSDMMATLFGEGVPDSIRSLDDLHKAVVEAATRQERASNLVKEYFGNALHPEAGVGAIGAKVLQLSVPQIENFRNKALKEAPELWQAIQDRAAVFFTNRFLSSSSADVLGKNLNNTLEINGKKIAAIYGQEHVDNLRTLTQVLDIHNLRTYKHAGQKDTQPLAIAVPRNLLGPLDPKQRFISSVFRIYDRYGTAGVNKLIRDPEALKKFVQIQKMSTSTLASILILSDIGYAGLLDDQEKQALDDYIRRRDMNKPLSSERGMRIAGGNN